MKTSLLFLLLVQLSTNAPAPKMVYICNSKTSQKYHLNSSCRGLNNCQQKVLKVTQDKAKSMGKTKCKLEK